MSKTFRYVVPIEGFQTVEVEAENSEQAVELILAGDWDWTGDTAWDIDEDSNNWEEKND